MIVILSRHLKNQVTDSARGVVSSEVRLNSGAVPQL